MDKKDKFKNIEDIKIEDYMKSPETFPVEAKEKRTQI